MKPARPRRRHAVPVALTLAATLFVGLPGGVATGGTHAAPTVEAFCPPASLAGAGFIDPPAPAWRAGRAGAEPLVREPPLDEDIAEIPAGAVPDVSAKC